MAENKLKILFKNWATEDPDTIVALPESGSYRKYFRLKSKNHQCLGVFNSDAKENDAFIAFTKHFLQHKLPVPQLYAENLQENIYLLEDFGDTTLFSHLQNNKIENNTDNNTLKLYKKVIEDLINFQLTAGKDLDYSNCYPRPQFDKQSMHWDLNYFKYYFLKLAKINFDEQLLEEDFNTFTNFLLQTNCNHFLYRDFQSRNIMIKDNTPYYIDYQGGRKGALQYDVASLLYDAKANLPEDVRLELLDHYCAQLKKHTAIDEAKFKDYYYGYVLIRIMQAMGAYGFRGFYENKLHFLQSIPYAIINLKNILNNNAILTQTPTLFNALQQICDSDYLKNLNKKDKLKIHINSFSYKKGIPVDQTGNGGGFVFDCRALPNPGRFPEYKTSTGKDANVIAFLEKEQEVDQFIQNILTLVSQSIEKYIQRDFSNLMISFGCTGGQHRSVYCAEKFKTLIEQKYDIEIVLNHIEQQQLMNL